MKIVVDTPEDYKKWLKEQGQKTIVSAVKVAALEAKATEEKAMPTKDTSATVAKDTTVVAHAEEKK